MALRLLGRARSTPLLHVALDEGSGPTIVLLHGIASSSASWRHLVPLLTPLYRVVAIDLLGFGGSMQAATDNGGDRPGFTLDEHVEAVHKTIRGLRLREPFALVGHSLGGLVAARYAAVHRRSVEQLVLVAPPIYSHHRYLDELGHRLRVGGYLWFYRLLRRNERAVVDNVSRLSRWLPGGGLAIDDDSWRAFSLSLENCIETQSAVGDLAQVSVPVDVVYGSRDQVIVPAEIERLGGMRHVQLHEVRRADHLMRTPLSQEVARVLR